MTTGPTVSNLLKEKRVAERFVTDVGVDPSHPGYAQAVSETHKALVIECGNIAGSKVGINLGLSPLSSYDRIITLIPDEIRAIPGVGNTDTVRETYARYRGELEGLAGQHIETIGLKAQAMRVAGFNEGVIAVVTRPNRVPTQQPAPTGTDPA